MNYLITGGTGSFGNYFSERLLLMPDTQRVVIFSRDEVKQAEMRERMPDKRLRFFIGDVRDRDRLRRAFESVDIVIHAAALKRIEVGEYNPGEMVKTNIIGAMNIIEAAQDASVEKVVALSTDKAYQPISPYGQSKALAESLFLNANNARGCVGPRFTVTRYGNVAFSRGSVIPKWRELLKTQGWVPVTHPDCTRFFMGLKDAGDLVQKAITLMPEHVLIPRLKAFALHDLAAAMSAEMKVTGLPDHEKMHESLSEGYSSDKAERMTIDELKMYPLKVNS